MKNPSAPSVSNLVAEQPGLLITVIGVIISVLIGLTLRALTREDILKQKLDAVIAGTGVQYDKVYFRLAHGWWPDFSVIVNQVHYEKQDPCMLSPSIDAHEVRIPFSVISLLLGEVQIEKIEVDSAVILLRAEAKDCKHEVSQILLPLRAIANVGTSTTEPTTISAPTPFPSTISKGSGLLPNSGEAKLNARLPPLIIEQLRVNYLPQTFASAEFKELELHLDQLQPLKFSIESAIEASAEFAARSQLRVHYDETQLKTMAVKLDGIWREGRFTLEAVAEKKTNKYELNFQAKQIPLSQMVPILRRYGIINSEFSGKQAWISFAISSDGNWTHMAHSPWLISKLQLEGDLGEVTSDTISFKALEPVQVDPFELKIEKLDIDQLLKFLGRPYPSPTLLSLGILRGNLHVESPRAMRFAGQLRGPDFIFANKGLREILPVVSSEIDVALVHDNWKGTLSNVKMADNGEFVGSINFKSPFAGDSLEVSTQFDKLKLQKSVGNLLSNGGTFPEWKGSLNFEFHKGQLVAMTGELTGDDGVIESIEMTHPKLHFYTVPREGSADSVLASIGFGMEMENAKVPAATIVGQYLQRLITPHEGEGESGTSFELYGITGKFQTESLRNFSWKNLEFQTAHEKFRSSGGWNDKDELFGELNDTDLESKRQVLWMIKGSRDQPELVLKDSSKN